MVDFKRITRVVQRFAKDIEPLSDTQVNDELALFQRTVFPVNGRQNDGEFSRWLYLSPRHGELLLGRKNGRVVGQQGAIKVTLKCRDRTFQAAWAIDLRVTDEWRQRGLGAALTGKLLSQYDVVLGLGISDEAKKMFLRQGWRDLGRINSYIRPVSPLGMSKTREERTVGASVVRGVIARLLIGFDTLVGLGGNLLDRRLRVKQVTSVNDALAKYLSSATAIYDCSTSRSKEFMDWRFFQFPLRKSYQVFVASSGIDICGVLVVSDGVRNGKRTLFIEELLADKGKHSFLVRFSIRLARSRSLDAIHFQGIDPELELSLRRNLFVPRKDGARFMAFSRDGELINSLALKRAWRVTMSDSDLGFS